MKAQVFQHYQHLLKHQSIVAKYPLLQESNQKINVLFVQCLMNQTGILRCYTPHLLLNETSSHNAIIANIDKRDFSKAFMDYDIPLHVELVQWADFIVFPVLLFDSSNMLNAILKVNPSVRFIMDVHQHPFENKDGVSKKRTTPLTKRMLLENMQRMHVVTMANKEINQAITQRFELDRKAMLFARAVVPNFLHASLHPIYKIEEKEENSIPRIGVFGSVEQEEIAKAFEELPLPVELIFYGKKMDYKPKNSNLSIKFCKPVNYLDFQEKVSALKLDLALIDISSSRIQTKEKAIRFAELSSCGIAVLSHHNSPISNYLRQGIGYVQKVEESLTEALVRVFQDRSNWFQVASLAQERVQQYLTWNPTKIDQLKSIYS